MKSIDKETLLARWLSGDLSPEEKALLEKEGTGDLKRLVKDMEQLQLSPLDADGMWAGVKRRPAPKTRRIIPRRLWRAGIAAMLVLGVGLFSAYQFSWQSITAATAALPDGSTMRLNEGATVTYNSLAWRLSRQVEMEGEVFFSVEKGGKFTVDTKNGRVRVLGTAFNVLAEGDFLSVQCHEGKVEVAAAGEFLQITAGQKVSLEKGGSPELTSGIRLPTEAPQWAGNESRFVDESLPRVLRDWGIRYGVKVEISEDARQGRFTGRFIHDDKEKSLYMICDPLGLGYEFTSPTEVSISKKE